MAGLIPTGEASIARRITKDGSALKSCHSEFHHLALMWLFTKFAMLYFPWGIQHLYILAQSQSESPPQ